MFMQVRGPPFSTEPSEPERFRKRLRLNERDSQCELRVNTNCEPTKVNMSLILTDALNLDRNRVDVK